MKSLCFLLAILLCDFPKELTEGVWMNEDGSITSNKDSVIQYNWANKDHILTKDGLLPVIPWPDGSGVTVDEDPSDPWVYDNTLAPYDVELLGVYNFRYRKYQIVKRTKDNDWESMEPTYSSSAINTTPAPNAWLKIPEPKGLPKLVDGMTKEQLLEKLKEFDE